MRKSVVSIIVVLFAAAATVGDAVAASYQFTTIAETGATFLVLESVPSIDAGGEVSFTARSASSGAVGVFRGDGVTTTTIRDIAVNFVTTSAGINDAGTVAFGISLDANQPPGFVVTGTGGALATISTTAFGLVLSNPVINDSGLVAFAGQSATQRGIFAGSGGAISSLAPDPSSGTFGTPSINASGDVAYRGSNDALSPTDPFFDRVLLARGGALTTIAHSGPEFLLFDNPSLNDAGTVAFRAAFQTRGDAILTSTGVGTLSIVIDSRTGPFAAVFSPSINSSGTIAFLGFPDADPLHGGIFVGPNPLTDAVIREGDLIDGVAVSHFELSNDALNDDGQITFLAQLANGRLGIFRADPVASAVPEPTTLALLGAGLTGFTLARRRRVAGRRAALSTLFVSLVLVAFAIFPVGAQVTPPRQRDGGGSAPPRIRTTRAQQPAVTAPAITPPPGSPAPKSSPPSPAPSSPPTTSAPAPASPVTCPTGSVKHSNGLGQSYCDSSALATPGNPGTYNSTLAYSAATAYPGSAPLWASSCPSSVLTLEKQTSTTCAVWAYAGPLAGHVTVNTRSNACYCPLASDPVWN